jgi:hypothetical protein
VKQGFFKECHSFAAIAGCERAVTFRLQERLAKGEPGPIFLNTEF